MCTASRLEVQFGNTIGLHKDEKIHRMVLSCRPYGRGVVVAVTYGSWTGQGIYVWMELIFFWNISGRFQ